MKKIKILAIIGSLRKHSYNRQLALYAQKMIGDRADFIILEYGDVPIFNEDIEFPTPPSVARVRDLVKSSDALWIFTPEHNHFFPSALKNIIDWLSRPISEKEPDVLAGKLVTYSGASLSQTGSIVAQDHLVSLISFLNMTIMNRPRVAVPWAHQQLDAEGYLALNSKSLTFLEKQVNAFLNFINMHQSK
ncbi:MAG: NAD(P)H-dependent oxidoreductase [Erysipelotrichia bacterium]|nr:NAD(P)H-dependent oxidoreductase [Erysipelotrichia bacterium]